MATVHYPSFDCALIDADGVRSAAASVTIDVYNVTAASSLGTVASNSSGIVVAGTFTATAGDVVEFSHATYPLTFRLTLAATAALAYTIKGNNTGTYVLEDLSTPNTSTVALLYAADNNNPDVEPVLIGSGLSGTTVDINYTTTVAKSLRIFARSQNDKQFARTNYDTASYADISVPGGGVFTYGSFALNDNANDHKLTVRVAEDLSADRILSILVNNASRTFTIAGNATVGKLAISTKTANYTLTDADDVILVDCTSGSKTITLHAVATAQQKPYIIKKIDSSANAMVIDGNASETIDGATTKSTTIQYTSYTIVPNNAGEWSIV